MLVDAFNVGRAVRIYHFEEIEKLGMCQNTQRFIAH